MNSTQMKALTPYPRSAVELEGTTYYLTRDPESGEKRLGVSGDLSDFSGPASKSEEAGFYPLTAANAAALRRRLPWLRAVPLGLRISFGFGDRLGLATPGHVQAARGTGIAPIFAQQSVRENARTGRSPKQVMDEAMWGVFEEGWREAWGADADHIKDQDDLAGFVEAGYTFYTVDPGDHVDNAAQVDPAGTLQAKVAALPWEILKSSPEALYRRFLDRPFRLEGFDLAFDETALLRAAAKYGRALAHAAQLYRRLAELTSDPFDFEVSVDETETPTSVHEHFYIASELRLMEIRWASLAPRFTGRFEKGVDYIGDPAAFEAQLARHAAIARDFGAYKISLHSGSDKFSIYPSFARHTAGLAHVKTAGTSYLEALRLLAGCEPSFFRAILETARRRYAIDRASYHVSAQLEKIPAPEQLTDQELPGLLEDFDARQALHVTYGSALDQFGAQLKAALAANEAGYYRGLRAHFARHLEAFRPGAIEAAGSSAKDEKGTV